MSSIVCKLRHLALILIWETKKNHTEPSQVSEVVVGRLEFDFWTNQ